MRWVRCVHDACPRRIALISLCAAGGDDGSSSAVARSHGPRVRQLAADIDPGSLRILTTGAIPPVLRTVAHADLAAQQRRWCGC